MRSNAPVLGALALLLPTVSCLAFGGPVPTPTGPERTHNGWSPKPTKGPSVVELRKRQSNSNPATCGWIDGDFSNPVSCASNRECMLFTVSGVGGMAGCCAGSDIENCGWAAACVAYDEIVSGLCIGECETNTLVRKCTESSAPYCVTWTYTADNIADYGCAATSQLSPETVEFFATDGNGDTTSISLSTIDGDAVALDIPATDSFENVIPSATDDAVVPGSTPTDDSLLPDLGLGSGGGSGGGSGKPKKKIPIGGIAGGVVGGVVIIGAAIAAGVFVCLRKRKQKTAGNAPFNGNSTEPPFQPVNNNGPNAYPPQMQQQVPQQQQQQQAFQQQNPYAQPQPQQQPNGYFAPVPAPAAVGYGPDKSKLSTQVHEYGVPSPVSNPASPAPAYVQPHYAATPVSPTGPLPVGSPPPPPMAGTHEIDAAEAERRGPPVFEIGGGGR